MEMSGAGKPSRMSSMMALFALILLFTGPVLGGLLNYRQEDSTSKSVVTAVTAPPAGSTASAPGTASGSESVSVSELGSASSAIATPTSDDPDRPVLATPSTGTDSALASATASLNGTATVSGGNATATGNTTAPLNENNDPHGCHRESATGDPNAINPFCDPPEGSPLYVNASYELTWDPSLFKAGSNVTIELQSVLNETTLPPSNTNNTLLTTTVDSSLGYTFINTTSSMLKGSSNASLALYLNTTNNNNPMRYSGPLLTLFDKTENATSLDPSSGDSSSKKKIGEEVGIPVGLIFFLIIIAALAFFFFRHRRNNSGYASGKSLPQRTNTGGGGGGGAGGHRRNESFHDEPTRGMELQDRHGGGDNWDWGRDSIGSPTSPTGNQFRDELERQKTGGRR